MFYGCALLPPPRVGRGARGRRPAPRAPRPRAKSAPRAPGLTLVTTPWSPSAAISSGPHPTPCSRLLLTASVTLSVDCPARLSHHCLRLPLLKCLSKHQLPASRRSVPSAGELWCRCRATRTVGRAQLQHHSLSHVKILSSSSRADAATAFRLE